MNVPNVPNASNVPIKQAAFHAKPVTTGMATKGVRAAKAVSAVKSVKPVKLITAKDLPKVVKGTNLYGKASRVQKESDAGDMSGYDPTGGTGHKI